MAERPLILQTPKSPRIHLRPDGRRMVVADASSSSEPKRRTTPTASDTFTAVGYRQTMEPAARGGKPNKNGFRFRAGSMRALARSFRGQAFITGHDWGDVRARGGTITDAYAEEITETAEMAILYEIVAQAAWAKEGLANGTIDRFSFGVVPVGEITCTVHGTPVWTECCCFPGEMVVGEGDVGEVMAEWEFESGEGVELSAVNVPAVDDTFIVDAAPTGDRLGRWAASVASRGAAVSELAELVGRMPPALDLLTGGAPLGGFQRATAARTMAITAATRSPENQMDPREEMAKALGLAADATWDQIRAKQVQVIAAAAQTEVARAQVAQFTAELSTERSRTAELTAASDRAHVEAEITRLRTTRVVSDQVIASLRTTASASRASFDSSIALVEQAAQAIPTPTIQQQARAAIVLQSDAAAALNGGAGFTAQPEPDAFEQHQSNPELPKLMRACKLTVANVREFGPKSIAVVHNLGDLIAATNARGA